jgi:hypothetical protein
MVAPAAANCAAHSGALDLSGSWLAFTGGAIYTVDVQHSRGGRANHGPTSADANPQGAGAIWIARSHGRACWRGSRCNRRNIRRIGRSVRSRATRGEVRKRPARCARRRRYRPRRLDHCRAQVRSYGPAPRAPSVLRDCGSDISADIVGIISETVGWMPIICARRV